MSILGVNIDTSNVPKMETSQTIGGKVQEASKTFNEFLKSSPGDENNQEGFVSEDNSSNSDLETTEILKLLKLLKLLKRRIFKILKRQIK